MHKQKCSTRKFGVQSRKGGEIFSLYTCEKEIWFDLHVKLKEPDYRQIKLNLKISALYNGVNPVGVINIQPHTPTPYAPIALVRIKIRLNLETYSPTFVTQYLE